EDEGLLVQAEVEGLLAHAVAREQEPLPPLIPERKAEHAIQLLYQLVAVLFVEVHDDLGVRVRAKLVAAFQQVFAQRREVVNLAVEDDPDRFVLVADRLLPARQINDRKAAHAERDIV